MGKVDVVSNKLSSLTNKMTKVEEKVNSNEKKVDDLLKEQKKHADRLKDLEMMFDTNKVSIGEHSTSLQFLSDSYELLKDHPAELKALKDENVELKKETDDLRKRLEVEKTARNIEQQYHRTSLNVKLCGVPLQESEDEVATVSNPVTLEAIKRVCSAASIIFDPASVDVCHRLGPSQQGRPSPIIIRFRGKRQRFHFFNQKQKLNNIKSVDFTDITKGVVINAIHKAVGGTGRGEGSNRARGRGEGGLGGRGRGHGAAPGNGGSSHPAPEELQIFMQEHLTKFNKELLKAARDKLREKFQYAGYVKNGQIRARIAEGQDFVIITNHGDIDRLASG
jgi:hypothetical protein